MLVCVRLYVLLTALQRIPRACGFTDQGDEDRMQFGHENATKRQRSARRQEAVRWRRDSLINTGVGSEGFCRTDYFAASLCASPLATDDVLRIVEHAVFVVSVIFLLADAR